MTRFLSIAYHAVSLLGCTLKKNGLLDFKTYLDQRQSYIIFKTKTELLLILELTAGEVQVCKARIGLAR